MKKQTYHHPDLMKTIEDMALDVIRKEGSFNLSMRALSARMGVSHNAIYHHFESKEQIVQHLVSLCFKRLNKHLATPTRAFSDEDPVVHLGLSYFRFCQAEPELYKFMFGQLAYIKPKKKDSEAAQAFEFLLRIAKGDKQYARFLWSVVHGLCSLLLANQFSDFKMTNRDIERKVVEVLRYHRKS